MKIVLSRNQWQEIGKRTGWAKQAAAPVPPLRWPEFNIYLRLDIILETDNPSTFGPYHYDKYHMILRDHGCTAVCYYANEGNELVPAIDRLEYSEACSFDGPSETCILREGYIDIGTDDMGSTEPLGDPQLGIEIRQDYNKLLELVKEKIPLPENQERSRKYFVERKRVGNLRRTQISLEEAGSGHPGPETPSLAEDAVDTQDEVLASARPLETWTQIRDREDPDGKGHDLRLVCTRCGNTSTCRCSKPKRTFHGVCPDCEGKVVLTARG